MIDVSEGRKQDVRKVKFGKGRREALIKYLDEEHSAAEQERDGMKKRWEGWVKQSNSRLKRTDASPRDSQIDMSLTRERLNMAAARLLSPIFQTENIMAGKPRTAGPITRELSRSVDGVMDFILDKSDTMAWAADWVEQFSVLPFGVVKTAFTRKIQNFKRWEELKTPEGMPDSEMYQTLLLDEETNSMVSMREFDDGSERYFIEVEDTREEKAGVFPEVIPANDFFFQDAADIETSDWVTHRTWPTKSNIAYKIRQGVYDEKTPEKDKILDVLGSPTEKREELLGIKEDNEEELSDVSRRYDIRETYLEFDVEGKDEPVEIIVTWERTKKIILRAVYNFFHGYERPFVIYQYKHIVGSMYGIPQTFDLEYPHKAYSASINQRLDAASKALATVTLLPSGHPLLKQLDTNSLQGGIYENPGYGKDDIIQLKLSDSSFTPLINLEEIFEHRADRVSHIPPQSYGEQPNRPNATSSMMTNEQSQFPQSLQLERFRKAFSLVVKHMLARYRQFYPEGMKYYSMSKELAGEDMQLEEMFFSWPVGSIEDDVIIQTSASSSTMSKMVRKQEIVALLEKMPELYQTMYQMAELASNPMNPAGPVAIKYLNGLKKTIDLFFREFEVGERDELNPDLTGGMLENTIQQLQQMVQQLQQQLQQLQQAGQQLQMENAEKDQTITALSAGLVSNPSASPELGGFS